MNRVQLGPAGDVVVLSVHYQIAQKEVGDALADANRLVAVLEF